MTSVVWRGGQSRFLGVFSFRSFLRWLWSASFVSQSRPGCPAGAREPWLAASVKVFEEKSSRPTLTTRLFFSAPCEQYNFSGPNYWPISDLYFVGPKRLEKLRLAFQTSKNIKREIPIRDIRLTLRNSSPRNPHLENAFRTSEPGNSRGSGNRRTKGKKFLISNSDKYLSLLLKYQNESPAKVFTQNNSKLNKTRSKNNFEFWSCRIKKRTKWWHLSYCFPES